MISNDLSTAVSRAGLIDLGGKWRTLALRRKAHLIDLYRSGRWRLYYTDAEFAECLRDASRLVDQWTATLRGCIGVVSDKTAGSRVSATYDWADIDLILLEPLIPLGEPMLQPQLDRDRLRPSISSDALQ